MERGRWRAARHACYHARVRVPHSGSSVATLKPTLVVRYLVISLVMLAVGGWLTSLGFGPWYDSLALPPWQPPAWVFSPAWFLILGLLAVATADVMGTPESAQRAKAQTYYWMQVILNVSWSAAFFAGNAPTLGLMVIGALVIVLASMVRAYGAISRRAGWLLVPYLLWLLFATSLNVWIVQHN